MKIGIVSFQGDVAEHAEILKLLDVQPIKVKYPYELEVLNGLIIPGGESTTVGFLLKESGMDKAIQKRAHEGMPIWGTCMGAILMAKKFIDNPIEQPTLGIMNIKVKRNAYGTQRESFEEEFPIPILKCNSFPGVFIRAPWFEPDGTSVEVLAEYQGKPVLVKEGYMLASSFHPEIAGESFLHKYFLDMVRSSKYPGVRGLSN
jgi:5'-phosphate synthase pdxT subunit